jgi:hypothetical protein
MRYVKKLNTVWKESYLHGKPEEEVVIVYQVLTKLLWKISDFLAEWVFYEGDNRGLSSKLKK